ncbi:MAG: 16S rRNA (adenine(1518)-N(6)/adenine(1519)-N(6))-dimethyltransferase [Flavobacteriales bacterium]|nr:16S rRNA (adenine(1518)-N(6)/adenine(1519)-N(6))-dimethyltransferase [Flavobacteriales bacterium]|tara:strand:+ start:4053 stop:4820 length:768 start_codon:yes stop_codon:yes gene_type:complete
MKMKAKKYLGQHFLVNNLISEKIVNSLILKKKNNIVEIGPGLGALTQYLINKTEFLKLIEIDIECIEYLRKKFDKIEIIHKDFLQINSRELNFDNYSIIGNFPYNISSQILFKILDQRDNVTQVVGMFQQEVAERICSGPKSKKYGILSVLIQAYFNCEKLFNVPSNNFDPPPKVNSAVIRLTRNKNTQLGCDHNKFVQIVKLGFSQRRKKLKNPLKKITNLKNLDIEITLNKRAEELTVSDFINLTNNIFPKSK